MKLTTVGASYMMDGKHLGPGPWLGLIHEINRRTDGKAFQSPQIVNRECYTEVYPEFDVEMRGEGAQRMLVTIVGKTPEADGLLWDAAKHMNLTIDNNED